MSAVTAGAPGTLPAPEAAPPRRRRVPWSREGLGRARLVGFLVDSVYVALGGLLAVAAAWPIYQNPQAVLVGVVGVVVGVLVALGGRILRWPWGADLGVAAVLYLVVAVPFATPSRFLGGRYLQGLGEALAGVVTGWKDLLTLDLPLGDYEAVLVPLLVVTLFGAYAATRVAVGARSAAIVTPVILLAMFAFGVAFGTSRIREPYALGLLPALPWIGTLAVDQVLVAAALLLVLLTIVWLALRSRRTRRSALARSAGIARGGIAVSRTGGLALLRRAGGAVVMVVAALAVAAAVALPAAGIGRTVIRDSAQPVQLTAEQAAPLDSYRNWFSTTGGEYGRVLFQVRAPETVDRLRIAVLDDYDGSRFSVSQPSTGSRFTRLPGAASAGGSEVTIQIGPGYPGVWVPTPGDVTGDVEFPAGGDRSVDLGEGLYYADDRSGAIVLPTGENGEATLAAGDTVTVTGRTVDDARAAIAAAPPAGALHGVTKDAYPALLDWIELQRPSADGTGLLSLIDALRARGYASHALLAADADGAQWLADLQARVPGFSFEPSRSGHSAARIETLFQQLVDRQRQIGTPADGIGGDQSAYVAAIGDDEQFAVAGALIAWAEGYDARVVLGVHLRDTEASLPPGGGEPAVEPCTAAGDLVTCTGQNVGAWIEVKAGGEWVPLDTSPQVEDLPQADDTGEQPPAQATLPERPAADTLDPPTASHTDAENGAADDPAAPAVPRGLYPALRIAGLGLGALGFLLLPPLVLLVAKRIRRGRRRVADPEAAIVGAWDEYLDECVDLGLVAAPRGTRRQIATAIGTPTAAQLAAIADLAVFGDTTPVEAQRDLAWSLVEAERGVLRKAVPFMQRVRAALAPASFLWRAREAAPQPAARGRGAERGR